MNSASKAVRNLGKKSANVVKGTYQIGKSTVQQTMGLGLIILVLIVYSAVVVKYASMQYLLFFDNMIVKIVALLIIAVVGLYCPSVALFLAIALIVTLQTLNQRRMSGDTGSHSPMEILKKIEKELTPADSMESMQDYLDPTLNQENPMDTMESMGNMGGDEPLGYNNNTSCIGSCGGGSDGNPSLSSQCGVVKTWNNQISAQGLNEGPVGYQSSVGYPVA